MRVRRTVENTLKGSGTEKRGWGNKDFKKEGAEMVGGGGGASCWVGLGQKKGVV